MTRIQPEEKYILKNSSFEIEATNRGAILRSIKANNIIISSTVDSEETKPGTKGAFFTAPIVFGRLIDRVLQFQGKEYTMQYPSDMDANEVDPNKIYIHGIHHWYTWDVTESNNVKITFELNKNRLEENYPFPHTAYVTYSLENSDLLIEVGVKNTIRPTPAMLTMHPFFKFRLNEQDSAPKLQVDLKKKFNYDSKATLPLNYDTPVDFENPFTRLVELPEDLDHSFLATQDSLIQWPNGLTLKIIDETSNSCCPFFPLQIWTTGAKTRNAFGVENGGPANLFWLVEHKKVPTELLPVINPGEEKSRKIRLSIMNTK